MKVLEYKKVQNLSMFMDYYPPKGISKNTYIIFIHGGGLVIGSRKWIPTWLKDKLISSGYGFFSIDHRLSPETALDEICSDVNDSIKFVKNYLTMILNCNFNLILMGASAGGYLALQAGTDNSHTIDGIISLSGFSTLFPDYSEMPESEKKNIPKEAALSLIGSTPLCESEDYARLNYLFYTNENNCWGASLMNLDCSDDSEKARVLLKPFSPIDNVDSSYPKTLLIHGQTDHFVSCKESISMHEKIGVEKSTLLLIPNKDHVFLDTGTEPSAEEEFSTILSFLESID